MKDLLMTQLLPQLFDYLIVALLGLMYAAIHRWTGLEIEAKHRSALQSALANGARLLLQPGGSIDDAIEYVLRSVPDALKRFGKTSPDDIRTLLEPHILRLPKPAIVNISAATAGVIDAAVAKSLAGSGLIPGSSPT